MEIVQMTPRGDPEKKAAFGQHLSRLLARREWRQTRTGPTNGPDEKYGISLLSWEIAPHTGQSSEDGRRLGRHARGTAAG